MYKPYLNVGVGNEAILADLIMRNESGGGLRTNNTLRHEEWIQYDDALIDVTREESDLWGYLAMRSDLVHNVDIGTSIVSYEKVTDAHEDVHTSMDGRANKGRDRPEFSKAYVPVPVHHVEWQLNARSLSASRKRGEDLETTNAKAAMANLYIHLNNLLVNGGYQYGGNTIYGLTDHPHRATVSITASDWNGNNVMAANVVRDVKLGIAKMKALHRRGPFLLIVPNDSWANLMEDYSAQKGDNTVLDRILAFPDIAEVRPCDQLESGNIVMFKANSMTLDLVIGMDIQNLEMDTQPFNTEYMTAVIAAPRLKSDANDEMAVVHMFE